ncbi:hypothetical protein WMY93_005595 [Mugilogobius chulae]|uniref:Uncharacterized protein n=1 Tax=Mugilogobius chulae TaxID=88201 RepID=A0AAW0PIB2_9GOBI
MAEFKGKGLDDITIDPEVRTRNQNQNIEEDLDTEMPDETNETSQPVTIETSNHPSLQAVQRPSRKGPSRTPLQLARQSPKQTKADQSRPEQTRADQSGADLTFSLV